MNIIHCINPIMRSGFQYDVKNPFLRFKGGGGETEQMSTLTGGQRDLLDALASIVNSQLSGNTARGITPYQGQRVADISPLQQMSYDITGGLGGGLQQSLGAFNQGVSPQAQGYLGQAGDLLNQSTQNFDPTNLLKSLEPGRRLALDTFKNDVIPSIANSLGSTSASSGALDKELARAGERLALGLGAQAQPLLYQGEQNALGRQFAGSGQAANLAQMPGQLQGQNNQLGAQLLSLLGGVQDIGSAQRGLEQQKLTSEQQKWLEAQGYNNPYVQQFAPLVLGTRAFENVVTPPSPGLGGAALGALGTIGGGLAGSAAGSEAILGALSFL